MDGRKPIARVEKIEGNVTVRTDSQMTWQKVKTSQDLYNNDLISTEEKSRVSITFVNGRKLQLTPGSVVKLGLPSPLSNDTEVSVLKGRLVVKAEDSSGKSSDDARMIFKTQNEKIVASNKSFDVNTSKDDSARALPVATTVGAAAAQLSATNSINSAAKTSVSLDALSAVKLSAMAPPPVIIKEKCEPPPEPEVIEPKVEDEEANAEKAAIPSFQVNLLPQIQPTSGEFWTAEPLKQVTDKALRLEIDMPTNLPRDIKDSWKGIVNISGPNGHIRVDGKAQTGKKNLSITLKDLLAAKVIKDLNQASFAINAGYSVESEAFTDAIEHSSPTTGVYSLRSLAEGEGIMIGFNKLQVESSTVPWLLVNPKASNRIWIGVTEPEDRKKLFEIVQGNAGQVSRADWPGIPARGAFIVRKDKIVGIVNGQDISAAEWDKIRRLFNADLIFRGSGHAYLSRKTFDVAKTNERTLYVLNRGEFVEVDVSLLRSRPRSMSFVQGVSSYLFREQPEILSLAH
ncbi:MAG: hypothetical protein V4655_05910 [Bdellovibrionota bacterium]